MSTTTTAKVFLYGKVHWAHPTATVRNGAGVAVPHPLCGQRSRRFYPSVIDAADIAVDCVKCVNHPNGGES